MGRGLTLQQQAVAAEMFRQGKTNSEVAKAINKSASTVLSWWVRIGSKQESQQSTRTLTPAQHMERLNLYKQGLSDRKMGQQLGVTRYAIIYWRNTNNLPPNHTASIPKQEPNVHFSKILKPTQIQEMRLFLQVLMTFGRQATEQNVQPNVTQFSDMLPPPTLTLRGGGFLGRTG